MPKKAIILAAGMGTRMQSLSNDIPKPLRPFWGKPILEHTINLIESWGVRDILINCHYRAEELISWVVKNPRKGVRISLSFEPEILGTGGALRKASWFIDKKPFWLINADLIALLDPRPFLAMYKKKNPLAVLWMHADRGPRSVEMQGNKIVNFATKNPKSSGTYTFCGLHLLDYRILKYLSPDGFSCIIEAYRKAIHNAQLISGVTIPDTYWADLGTPDNYLNAHAEALHQKKLSNVLPSKICPLPAVNFLRKVEIKATKKQKFVLENTCILPFPPRGSDRSLCRVSHKQSSLILIRYGRERKENNQYAYLAQRLGSLGIRTPKVLLNSPAHRFLLFEDLGKVTLRAAVQGASEQRVKDLYRKVINQLCDLQSINVKKIRSSALQPTMNEQLFKWEHDFFLENYLQDFHPGLARQIKTFRSTLELVSTRLEREKKILTHRDFQSSNLMIKNNEIVLIDFQGLRKGPGSYDLSSLLADPYVSLSEEQQMDFLEYYIERTTNDSIRDFFWWACMQRLLQALGAFGRMGKQPETKIFLSHIPPALKMMERVLYHLPELEKFREFLDKENFFTCQT